MWEIIRHVDLLGWFCLYSLKNLSIRLALFTSSVPSVGHGMCPIKGAQDENSQACLPLEPMLSLNQGCKCTIQGPNLIQDFLGIFQTLVIQTLICVHVPIPVHQIMVEQTFLTLHHHCQRGSLLLWHTM